MKKQIELKQNAAGQWMYQIIQAQKVVVEWQYGPFTRENCIEQAKGRFGYDLEIA
jgi:hypothetical protein